MRKTTDKNSFFSPEDLFYSFPKQNKLNIRKSFFSCLTPTLVCCLLPNKDFFLICQDTSNFHHDLMPARVFTVPHRRLLTWSPFLNVRVRKFLINNTKYFWKIKLIKFLEWDLLRLIEFSAWRLKKFSERLWGGLRLEGTLRNDFIFWDDFEFLSCVEILKNWVDEIKMI